MPRVGENRHLVKYNFTKPNSNEMETERDIIGVNVDQKGNILTDDYEAIVRDIIENGKGNVIRETISIAPLDKYKPKE